MSKSMSGVKLPGISTKWGSNERRPWRQVGEAAKREGQTTPPKRRHSRPPPPAPPPLTPSGAALPPLLTPSLLSHWKVFPGSDGEKVKKSFTNLNRCGENVRQRNNNDYNQNDDNDNNHNNDTGLNRSKERSGMTMLLRRPMPTRTTTTMTTTTKTARSTLASVANLTRFEPRENIVSITEKRRLMTIMAKGYQAMVDALRCAHLASSGGDLPPLPRLSSKFDVLWSTISKMLSRNLITFGDESEPVSLTTSALASAATAVTDKDSVKGINWNANEDDVDDNLKRNNSPAGRVDGPGGERSVRGETYTLIGNSRRRMVVFKTNDGGTGDLNCNLFVPNHPYHKRRLGNLFLQLIKLLEDQPRVRIRLESKELTDSASQFVGTLKQLVDHLLKEIRISCEEKEDIDAYKRKVKLQWKKKQYRRKQLEQQSLNQKALLTNDLNSMDEEIEAVTKRIFLTRDSGVRGTTSLAAQKEESIRKLRLDHAEKREKLERVLASKTTTLTILQKDHFAREQALRKRKFRLETEIDNWREKYDHDMDEMEKEESALMKEYDPIRTRLRHIEEKFATVYDSYTEIIKCRKEEERISLAAKTELKEMNNAAALIQAFWRGRAILMMKRRMKKK